MNLIVTALVTANIKLDEIVAWLLSKASTRTLADGTVTYYFEGRLPKRMIDVVRRSGLTSRDAGREVVYSWSGALGGFSVTAGAYRSTECSVRFTANDYTVPATAGQAVGA